MNTLDMKNGIIDNTLMQFYKLEKIMKIKKNSHTIDDDLVDEYL